MTELRRLKFAATINDEALPEDTDPDYELLYIDISNVDSTGNIGEIASYKFTDAPTRARRKVQHGDVIISTVRTYLQAIAPIKDPPDNLIVSTGFAVIRPKKEVLTVAYCKYALREPGFLAEVVKRSVGVSYPAINASELGDIDIYLHSLDEQRAIADYLDRETAKLGTLIAAKERLLDRLAEKRRALITHAVTRGLDSDALTRDSSLPWIGKIPSHWRVERARYLFNQASLPVREEDEMVTCFRDGEVTLRKNRRIEGFTNAIKELGYQGVRAGQLVIHSMDAFAGAIGVSDSDGKCSPEYIVCDPVSDDISNQYYGHLVRTMALNGFIQASCPAVRERAPRIRFNDFKDMFFPVPPPDEQRAIVKHIKEETTKLDALQASAEKTIALLKERRAALIAEAVTGQLAVARQATLVTSP